MSQFIDSIKEVKRNWKTYDAWEQDQANDAAQREYLSKKLELPADKVALTREKTKIVLRASDMLDKRSENNCEDTERTTSIIASIALLPFLFLPSSLAKSKLPQKTINRLNLASYPAMFIIAAALILWGNDKQKNASRIGRFQAKQHELKDVKNFVIYTPEQIEAAKIVAKNIPDKKDDKSISKLFAEMKQMSQDKIAYKAWLKDKVKDEDELKKVLNTKFTPEQIEQGKEDKEIITNIVKDINLKAEEYSENMENAYDTLSVFSGLASIPVAYGINKLIKNVSKKPGKLSSLVTIFSPVLVTMAILFLGTSQQKKAAQVGRFKKSQEILNNPEALMNYTDEQMTQAQHIKASKKKEGFFQGIFSDFKFFQTYSKDKKEYDNYLKTEGKQEEKLYEALKQTEISDKQLKDAQFMKQKTFMTFDKIDEMSQRYSEDTEAGTDLAKQATWLTFPFLGVAATALLGKGFKNGKIPLRAPLKTAFNIALRKESFFREFVNKMNKIVKGDKSLRKNFSKIFVNKDARKQLANHPEVQKLSLELMAKTSKYSEKLSSIAKTKNEKEIADFGKEIMKEHFRQDPFSKWLRNFSSDIFRMWAIKKFNLPSKLNDKSLSSFEHLKYIYKEFNTFCKTIILGGFAPILGIGIGIPFIFNSWLNNIQKKAGKIGIMKAMNDLDSPQLYVNNNDTKQ